MFLRERVVKVDGAGAPLASYRSGEMSGPGQSQALSYSCCVVAMLRTRRGLFTCDRGIEGHQDFLFGAVTLVNRETVIAEIGLQGYGSLRMLPGDV